MVDNNEILPCPFCGYSELSFQEGCTFRWLRYECQCGIGSEIRYVENHNGPDTEATKIEAIRAWNTRTTKEPNNG